MTGTALAEKSCAEYCGFHLLGLLETFLCLSADSSVACNLGFKEIEKYDQVFLI